MEVHEILFLLRAKGVVTVNNLRLSFHLTDEQIAELVAAGLIVCVHKKENKMDDDRYAISELGLEYLEEKRK